jgi:ketosteroid isomerase-like protein
MTNDGPQTCMAQFTAALLRRDMQAALELLTDDAVLFFGNGTALWGKAQREKLGGGIFRRSHWRIAHEHLSAGQWKP